LLHASSKIEIYTLYLHDALPIFKLRKADLEGKKGAFGKKIKGNSLDDMLLCLPIYAQNGVKEKQTEFPDWKKYYIRANREFYKRSEEHTSELQSRENLVCRLLLE